MNKKTKKIIIAILIVISCFGLYKIVDATSYTFVRMKAEAYLCQKYDAKPSEIELVDYKPAQIYWDDYYIFWLTPGWSDFSFEYKYKNRKFIVDRIDGKFYDDYQLEDIEKWCTEWLKENVDKRIIGINIDSRTIRTYQQNSGKGNTYIITDNDVKEFLTTGLYRDRTFRVYFYDQNIDIKNSDEDARKIENKLYSKICLINSVHVAYLDSYLVAISEKQEELSWYRYYASIEYYERNYKNFNEN